MNDYREIAKEFRDMLKGLEKFERKQMGKIEEKTMELRILIKATEEGRLPDLIRLGPAKYKKTMTRLAKT